MDEYRLHRESSEDLQVTHPLRFAKTEVPPVLVDVPREMWQLILTPPKESPLAFSSYDFI